MAKLYGVLFGDNKKSYYKASEEFLIGDRVIVDTERKEQLAKVYQIVEKSEELAEGTILRKATDEEYEKYIDNLKDADKAHKKCRELVLELGLEMNVINAQYNLDRSQLLFNFTADTRIDFRDLAKKLASLYHTRIELRQIGARDKAKDIGGIGVCGAELCCVRFLKNMNTITMNMAKDQNLALNPGKINGACGRLLCCLEYEDETYLECLKGMPSMGDIIKTGSKEGPVVGINVLDRSVMVLVDGEKVCVKIDENSKK